MVLSAWFCFAGEYHLFVDKVTLADDAVFQCQVGPGGGDPSLVAEVQLSVISQYLAQRTFLPVQF